MNFITLFSSAVGDGCDGLYPAEPGNSTKGLIS